MLWPMSPSSLPAFNPFETVHASAGSGKTYQLVRRIICLLLHGAEPGGILAITFTRKAAAEMTQRLLQRVQELATLSGEALDNELRELGLAPTDLTRSAALGLFEKLLHSHYPVRSTTYHAFCQDLLRRFPMEADVPPGFELIEITRQLLDEAWDSFASWLTRHSTSATAQAMDVLLQKLGSHGSKAVLYGFVERRSDWWALTRGQDDPVAYVRAQIEANIPVSGSGEPLADFFADELLHKKLQTFAQLLRKHPIDSHMQAADHIETGLRADLPQPERLAVLWNAFYTGNDTPRSRKGTRVLESRLGAAGVEEFLGLHDMLCERLADLRRQLHAVDTLELSRAWLQCGNAFLAHFQRSKDMQRVLDFTDLEWKSFLLLSEADHADWVQYKLDQRIDHLLIDEFQDTNPIQWQLVLPLLQELAAAHSERARSVMFVGDSKQSIYRFRRAEPRLFDTASDWLMTHLPGAQQTTLSKSWRSSPAVIDFVNRVFNDNPNLPLTHFEPHNTQHTQLWGRVTLLPLVEAEKQDKSPGLRNPLLGPRPQEEAAHYREAQLIAQTIRQLMQDKPVVGRDGKAHVLRYADILILFRSRTAVSEYERALREAHIPYLGTERGTLLDSLEVRDMINLLQWLITPFNNLALAGILRSPLFAASNADLMQLAGKGDWYARLLELAAGMDDAHPFARAARYLQAWMPLADQLPVHDLLDRIYSEANVMARYKAAFPAHLLPRVSANLTRFLELALESDSGRYPSLTRFIAWLDLLRQQDKEAPDQPPGQGEQDRIRLMTVHEAKGLEAPVVFVADASREPAADKGARILVDWADDGTQPDCFVLSASGRFCNTYCEQISQRLQQKDAQEEANLLYVALTRAEQLLYISAARKAGGWYAEICKAHSIAVETLEQAVCLQAHGQPGPLPNSGRHGASHDIEVDPRLRELIVVPGLQREIAPSYQVDWQGSHRTLIDEDARERGIVVHTLLDKLSQTPDLSLPTAQALFPALAADLFTRYWHEAQQVREHFAELFDPAQYEYAYSEVPLYYRRNGQIVHGIIDRLICYADRTLIVDYKTHRIDASQIPALVDAYRAQLQLYAEGARQLFANQPVQCQLLFTALPQRVDVPA